MSHSVGSTEGGLELVLTSQDGSFTDDTTEIDVKVDGTACDVVSASAWEIRCSTGASAASVSVPNSAGHRGVTRRVYQGIGGSSISSLTGDASFPDSPDITESIPNMQAPYEWGSNYGQTLIGLFEAPSTGNYVFFVASDDHSELLLGSSSVRKGGGRKWWVT